MPKLILTTERLLLCAPELNDAPKIQDFEELNCEHLSLWETIPTEPFNKRLSVWLKDIEEERSLRFLLIPKDKEIVIGICNFTQIFRGAFHACYLGYKIDQSYQGKGLMTEALKASILYMFNVIQIHRIMANYMPSNERSAKLLKKLGFVIEGKAKEYLLINQKWLIMCSLL